MIATTTLNLVVNMSVLIANGIKQIKLLMKKIKSMLTRIRHSKSMKYQLDYIGKESRVDLSSY